jgi:hypothetical protein
MNPVGILLTLGCVLAVAILPRRGAALGLFAAVCYITQGQMIDVGGFHFTSVRFVLLAGFIRVVAKGELRSSPLNMIDKVLILFALVTMIVSSVRMGVWQEQVGNAYNLLLSYFVLRGLVADWEEAQELFAGLAVLIVPLALCMILESLTGKNVFDFMGGHDDESMREGRYRCIGSFRGPHTSGTFGATLMPMFVGLYFMSVRQRPVAVAGFIAATIMTYTANASGPLMAFLSCMLGLAFWPVRTNMKRVRQGLVVMLVLLGFTMKAPIWYIMAKISSITGGDGWYRSYLMEQCWNHMSDWWLMGTSDTSTWAVTLMSWGGADLCNLYVSCAANAGLASLILIILLLVLCFRYLGLALAVARDSAPEAEMLLWCLGAALFAHVVTLFSVTYFDQMHVAWWGLLAIISSISSDLIKRAPAQAWTEDLPEAEFDETGGKESMARFA